MLYKFAFMNSKIHNSDSKMNRNSFMNGIFMNSCT